MKQLKLVGLLLAVAAASLGTAFAVSPEPVVLTAATPEPGSWALLVAGLIGAGAIARRRLPN